MTVNSDLTLPVHLQAEDRPALPPVTPELVELYEGFEKALLVPLWTQPHRWQWQALLELASRARQLVPVGREVAGGAR